MATSKRDKRPLEEDEDDLVDNDELNIELQPHLSHLHHPHHHANRQTPAVSQGESYAYVGPAGQDDVSASFSSQSAGKADVTPTSSQSNVVASGDAINGSTSQTTTTPSTNGFAADGRGVTASSQSVTTAGPTPQNPVYYDGQSVVMQAPVVTTRPDGSRAIQTHQIADYWREHQRPLRQRKIKMLKIVSVVAMIVFFPTGIPAFYYARRTEQEFEAGIMRGNIDRALKFAKRTEHLIIFSFIFVIAVVILAFALIEQRLASGDDAYIHRGIITGQ